MSFKRTARKIHKCGECVFFDKNQTCTHEKMNKKKVKSNQEWQCDEGQYFKPLNDYEDH